uniref:NADH-ubiquinone oxidoreductase chain 2 n=1 Tax=Pachydactylus latirostris TaxID=1211946 RepID=J7FHI1_9SAUR|nr:NADH dehydrogenase subunit 2 [Pachydactylus mariquensis latirostris]
MNPMTWTIFTLTLSTSTIIVLSCNHWLLAWLGLELNTLSILPIIMKPHHPRATEAATKYFLIQTTASALILFASTLNAWKTGNWTITLSSSTTSDMVILSALLLKMGIAPAHLWYPDVIQGSNMLTALTISTWQKLAPLTLLYLTINHTSITTLMLIGLLSVIVGGWGGLNQTQTRKILAFSSIAHMGWLLIALAMNPHLATITMIVYLVMTTTVFLALTNSASKTLQDLGSAWAHSPALLATTTATLLSLGGLPPLTGFMPKLLILKELTLNELTLGATVLALMSLPSLYFYTRMAYITNLTTPPSALNTQHKWRFKTTQKLSPTLITPLTTLALPMTPLFFAYT